MTKETILALIRHGLTAFGGLLVSSGLAAEGDIETVAGAAVVIIGFSWSLWRKWDRKNKTGSAS